MIYYRLFLFSFLFIAFMCILDMQDDTMISHNGMNKIFCNRQGGALTALFGCHMAGAT